MNKKNESRPYLIIDLSKVKESYHKLKNSFNDKVVLYYAMKCNPNPEIMKTVLDCGGRFEVASYAELKSAMEVGAKPEKTIFSNPVKSLEDIELAYKTGLRNFAFDSYDEADKLAKAAPGSNVYVRMAVPVGRSRVPSEGKFGVSLCHARDLMVYAKKSGLNPCGASFHVGSQMLNPKAWLRALKYVSRLFDVLKKEGIQLSFLDIGGGFPVCYRDVDDDKINKISEIVLKAVKKYFPADIEIAAEPGRYMVAEAGTMVTEVIGRAERFGRSWVHLNAGAFNGFMEALETRNTLEFPVRDSRNSDKKAKFTVTGPTCDSQDIVLIDAPLSFDIQTGDQVYFDFAGAYTTTYTGLFNGFLNPVELIRKTEKKECSDD